MQNKEDQENEKIHFLNDFNVILWLTHIEEHAHSPTPSRVKIAEFSNGEGKMHLQREINDVRKIVTFF